MKIRRLASLAAGGAATLALLTSSMTTASATARPADDGPIGSLASSIDDVKLPAKLSGYKLATAGDSYDWGDMETDYLPQCFDTTAVGAHTRVGQYYEGGHMPRVGELFYVRLDVAFIGSACLAHTELMTEWLAPSGADLWSDAKHPLYADVWSEHEDPQWSTGPFWISNPGQHGGTNIQATKQVNGQTQATTWDLRRGDVLTLFVPVKALRTLKGDGTRSPGCTGRTQGLGPCPKAEVGDHLQVGVRGTHFFGGGGGWAAPYVGLLAASVTSNPPVTPKPPAPKPPAKVNSAVAAKAVSKLRAKKTGKIRVAVRASGQRPTGTIVIKEGRKVLGRATLASAHKGIRTIKIKALKKGRHTLTVVYSGSSRVKAKAINLRVKVAKK